ncbi:Intraflagellar transport protein [Intoshia linei]|uniref:Intraflagellar transport protein 122 homolog n=1 Tax=Intoshia linei TaxID=1819745 RepID=A0A177B697_9BILA|nr:Intraflagellar transport protein [Intoshia linei]
MFETRNIWKISKTSKEDKIQTIWSVCFSPEGEWIVSSNGKLVDVHSTTEGVLIKSLRGHKDIIYSVAFSAYPGEHFASGSADKMVIIWNRRLDPIMKFSLNDSIQSICFNPVLPIITACSISNYGNMYFSKKDIKKYNVNNRITCCDWSLDGQLFAIGQYRGTVIIFGLGNVEKYKLNVKKANVPIWCIKWSNIRDDVFIFVGQWNRTLTLYNLNSEKNYTDTTLSFDPCFIHWIPNKPMFIIGGSNGMCQVMNKDGVYLSDIVNNNFISKPNEEKIGENWILSGACSLKNNFIVTCKENGEMSVQNLQFKLLYAYFNKKYAIRENGSNVVIHDWNNDKKFKIKCKDRINKIALYTHRLAIVQDESIIIYQEISKGKMYDIQYKLITKIAYNDKFENFIVFTNHFVVIKKHIYEIYSFDNILIGNWMFDCDITYSSAVGGAPNKEYFIIGCSDGNVYKSFVHFVSPITIAQHTNSILYAQVNPLHQTVAFIDDTNTLFVVDIDQLLIIYQEPNAIHFKWNCSIPDILVFNSGDTLHFKMANFGVHSLYFDGRIIDYDGTKIYLLVDDKIEIIHISHNYFVEKYIENGQLTRALDISSYGIDRHTWSLLGEAALYNLNMDVAKIAYQNLKDFLILELIYSIELKKIQNVENDILMGEIYAYNKKYNEAAKCYMRVGQVQMVIDMFILLRMFEKAKEWVNESNSLSEIEKREISSKEAHWAAAQKNPAIAIELFLENEQYTEAIDVASQNNSHELIMKIANKIDRGQTKSLYNCVKKLLNMRQYLSAIDVLSKMGDFKKQIEIYVHIKDWDKAIELAEKNEMYRELAYYPYAVYLAENGQFDEAHYAYQKAGRSEDAIKVLHKMLDSSLSKSIYEESAYYCWKLAQQCLMAKDKKIIHKFENYYKLSAIYFAYRHIHSYIEDPFIAHENETIFNVGKYLINTLYELNYIPKGISQTSLYYTLGNLASSSEAYRLALYCFEKLQHLYVSDLKDNIDLQLLLLRTKPNINSEDLNIICYRCSKTLTLVNEQGNKCPYCGNPLIYSYSSFEILPLVKFQIDADITDEEAEKLIKIENEQLHTPTDFLHLSSRCSVIFYDMHIMYKNERAEIVLNRESLSNLNYTDVIICKWPQHLSNDYYHNMMPGAFLNKCDLCNNMDPTPNKFKFNPFYMAACGGSFLTAGALGKGIYSFIKKDSAQQSKFMMLRCGLQFMALSLLTCSYFYKKSSMKHK